MPSGYQVREVVIARFAASINGGPAGKVQKFYQTFILQENGSSDCWAVYNWGAGAEGSIHADPRGQLQLATTGPVSYSRASSLASLKMGEKLAKGYSWYTSYGATANIGVPPKIEDLINGTKGVGRPIHGVGPSAAANGPEVSTVADCLARAQALFSGDASAGFILAKGKPGEAVLIRQTLAENVKDMDRFLDQARASLDLLDEALGLE